MSKREEKKDHILQCGLEAMKSLGYNGTGVKDIVDAAGVPKGSFYTYFDSKEAFAVEAIDSASNLSLEQAKCVLSGSGLSVAPLECLARFFSGNIDQACKNDYTVGCFLGNMCQEMSDSSEAIRCKLREALRRHTLLIQDVLELAQEQGLMSSEKDASVVAEFLFNAWEGALMRMKASRCRDPLDAFLNMLPIVVGGSE